MYCDDRPFLCTHLMYLLALKKHGMELPARTQRPSLQEVLAVPQLGLGREKHLKTLPGGSEASEIQESSVVPPFVTCLMLSQRNRFGPMPSENFAAKSQCSRRYLSA